MGSAIIYWPVPHTVNHGKTRLVASGETLSFVTQGKNFRLVTQGKTFRLVTPGEDPGSISS